VLWYARTRPQKHCNVRALSHRVKCCCSVQRIRTNINNLPASKCATIHCQAFCIVDETGTHFFPIRSQREKCCIEPDDYHRRTGRHFIMGAEKICIEIFLSFRVFEQLAFALKKEFPLQFFEPGVLPPRSPSRTPMMTTSTRSQRQVV